MSGLPYRGKSACRYQWMTLFSTGHARTPMGYLQSAWIRLGLALLAVGACPLVFIVVGAQLRLWPREPNPIGPELLFFVTFWPGVICIIGGVTRVRLHRER